MIVLTFWASKPVACARIVLLLASIAESEVTAPVRVIPINGMTPLAVDVSNSAITSPAFVWLLTKTEDVSPIVMTSVAEATDPPSVSPVRAVPAVRVLVL